MAPASSSRTWPAWSSACRTTRFDVRLDDKPVSGFGVTLLPGANALEVADAVKARMDELQKGFPPGVEWFVALDATTFITHAIKEVIFTLVAAVVLVFIVMLVFLQSFRATLIPTLVVPVALMGAFIGMEIFGFSINQLTLFGMVLAIGIVVDDAIVVIESVERIMREEHLSPKDATRKAMDQITSPIIAISLVLAAVFVPAAMQTGSVGVIYQQFALTIAISMLFSAFLALSLTPALCATLLRPEHLKENKFFGMFNRGYDWTQNHYLTTVKFGLRHKTWWMAGFVVLVAGGIFLFLRVPGSFVPDEDQGYAIGVVSDAARLDHPAHARGHAPRGREDPDLGIGGFRIRSCRVRFQRQRRERRNLLHPPQRARGPQGDGRGIHRLGLWKHRGHRA